MMEVQLIYQPLTELEAVNIMLATINEAPVNTLESTGLSEVSQARTILTNVLRDVQTYGWNFNSETNYPLTPDTDGYISVPINTLKIDATDTTIDVVLRGTRLYDKYNHTYKFTASIKADIVFFLQFGELPQTARTYIAIKAAREFQRIVGGSESFDKMSQLDEYNAWLNLIREESDSTDLNLLTSTSIATMLDRT